MKKAQLILVVENREIVNDVLVNFILHNFPKTAIMLAKNSGDGLNKVINYQPDVVIISVNMENGSGQELAQEIFRQFPGLPCIFMSGNYREEVQDGKKELIFMEDSYHLDELKKELEKVLKD